MCNALFERYVQSSKIFRLLSVCSCDSSAAPTCAPPKNPAVLKGRPVVFPIHFRDGPVRSECQRSFRVLDLPEGGYDMISI